MGLFVAARLHGDAAQPEVGVDIGRLQLEDPPELLRSFRHPAQIQKRLAVLQQRIDVAGVIAKIAEEHLQCAVRSIGRRVHRTEPRPQTRDGRVDAQRLPQTPLRAVVETLLHQAFGDHGQAVSAAVLQRLLGQIKTRFGLVVVAQPHVALDLVGVGKLALAVHTQRLPEPVDGPFVFTEAIGDDPRRQQRVQLPRHEVDRPLVAGHRFGVPFSRLQGETEVEVPLRLVRVQGDRLAELRLRLGPATAIIHIQGPIGMLFGVKPFAHGGDPAGYRFRMDPRLWVADRMTLTQIL